MKCFLIMECVVTLWLLPIPCSWNFTLLLPLPIFYSFITESIYVLKSQGDMIQTCLTPLAILKHSLPHYFTLKQARLLTYILLIPFNILPPTSDILSSCYSASLLILPYAFSRYIKTTYTLYFFPLLSHLSAFGWRSDLHTPSLLWNLLVYDQLNPQSLYELCLLGSLHIFFQLNLTK